jgi:hypothetical protein
VTNATMKSRHHEWNQTGSIASNVPGSSSTESSPRIPSPKKTSPRRPSGPSAAQRHFPPSLGRGAAASPGSSTPSHQWESSAWTGPAKTGTTVGVSATCGRSSFENTRQRREGTARDRTYQGKQHLILRPTRSIVIGIAVRDSGRPPRAREAVSTWGEPRAPSPPHVQGHGDRASVTTREGRRSRDHRTDRRHVHVRYATMLK